MTLTLGGGSHKRAPRTTTSLAQYRLARAALDLRTFTVAELESLAGVPRNTVYSFVANLGDKLKHEEIASVGRGRPRKNYTLTTAGFEELLERNLTLARILGATADQPVAARNPTPQNPGYQEPRSPSPIPVAADAHPHVSWSEPIAAGERLMCLESVSKVFVGSQAEHRALKDVELEVAGGEFLEIVGAAGSGKTTLFLILGLLEEPTSGEYWLGHERVTHLPTSDRERLRAGRILTVHRSRNLIDHFTVHHNVAILLRDTGAATHTSIPAVEDALEGLALAGYSQHYPPQLTVAQRRRMALVPAFVRQPEILLLDEPTTGLTAPESAGILDLLQELHEMGVTICMTSRKKQDARVAQRRIVLSEGQVVEVW